MLNSDDLAFFLTVSRSRSLAEAARKLDITPSAVTQRLRTLETRAGVRLFDRSSRHLAMTDDGAMVAEHGAVVAGAIDTLTEALRDRAKVVTGHLRVVAPSGFGRTHVAPIAAAFARAHPKVTLTLDLSDRPSARLWDAYDIVIHIGPSPAPNVIVTTLAENRRVLCASPDYLRNAPPIRSPEDLTSHPCLVLRENDEDVTLWRFGKGRRTASIRVRPAMSTNDGTVIRDWARAGLGLAIRSEWDVADDLRENHLQVVLEGWEPPAANVIAIPGARHGRSARTAAFLAMMRSALSPPPWRRPKADNRV